MQAGWLMCWRAYVIASHVSAKKCLLPYLFKVTRCAQRTLNGGPEVAETLQKNKRPSKQDR